MSSKDLLYSEHMGNHNLVGGLRKEKPTMTFIPSKVLKRMSSLIPQLQEAEKTLDMNQDNNIELIGENESFVEMNVAVVNTPDDADDEYSDEQGSDDELEFSNVETFSPLKTEIESQLPPSVKICMQNDQKSRIEEVGMEQVADSEFDSDEKLDIVRIDEETPPIEMPGTSAPIEMPGTSAPIEMPGTSNPIEMKDVSDKSLASLEPSHAAGIQNKESI